MIKLKITTHSGSEHITEVEEYKPAEINEQLNKNEINTIILGDVILSRIDVKSIVPIIEEPLTDE